MKKAFIFLMVLALVTTLSVGCAALTQDGATKTSGTGFGAIEVLVTDAPKYDVNKVLIYFSGVSVHKAVAEQEQEQQQQTGEGEQNQTQEQEQQQEQQGEGEWIDIPIENGFFDLVALGKADLEGLLAADSFIGAGKYTQIRVTIDEDEGKGVQVTYTDYSDPQHPEGVVYDNVPAKLPSGVLKFVQPFDVVDGTTTIITLDFDIEKSVVFAGAGKDEEAKVIVKPVVKLSVERESLVGTIAGTVTVSGTGDPISGATISVEGTELSAITNTSGEYSIADVPVGAGTATYTVTASADGYQPSSQDDVSVSTDTTSTVNFTLVPIPIDLALLPTDIGFNPASPTAGDVVTVTATIHNIGGVDISNLAVRFYDGDPAAGGTQIDSDQVIASIVAGGTGNASVDWTSVAGNHDIYVVADPDNAILESDETNNKAFSTITVASSI